MDIVGALPRSHRVGIHATRNLHSVRLKRSFCSFFRHTPGGPWLSCVPAHPLCTRLAEVGIQLSNHCVEGVSGGVALEIDSLKTSTPEEGFQLAIRLSQKGVVETQPSEEIRQRLRPIYSTNANSLIAVSQVIAINFQTVAAANNYWA